jgi:subtilisin-like proprotein convertase family protein
MMEVKVMAEPVKEKEEKEYGKYDKWEVESWVRSICEAEEVKADPEKMKYVAPLLKQKMKSLEAVKKSISSIEDIRKIAKGKSEEMENDDE